MKLHKNPGFEPMKHPEDHKNVEWVHTKRGLKQYFHTTCWDGMIDEQKKERAKCREEK